MNTKNILNTLPKSLPNLPILSSHKQNKTVSKHFTNLAAYCDGSQFTMLCWLLYESDGEYRVRYSTRLLEKFSAHLKAIKLEYGAGEQGSVPTLRKVFKRLIENGYLIPAETSYIYHLNPMLVGRDKDRQIEYQINFNKLKPLQ